MSSLVTSRWIMAYVGIVGFTLLYVLRANLSIGMVCMVKVVPKYDSTNSTSVGSNDTCSADESGGKERTVSGEIEWSKDLQGHIHSSFFYGYMLMQIPGGWLAGRYGGRRVYGIGMAVNAIANLLLPLAARFDGTDFETSAYLVIALRVIMGLATAPTFPSMNNLWGKWAPPLERTRLLAVCYAGTTAGNIIILGVGGYMCEWTSFDGGWPSLFYIWGGCGALFCFLWFYCVHDSPADHPRISKEEREYIENSLEEGSNSLKMNEYIPWRQIITSPAVWAIATAHVCNNFGAYTIITTLPTFMKEVFKFDIAQNGLYSALPHIGMLVITLVIGDVADRLRTKKILSTVALRKISQTIGFVVPAGFIVGIGFISCELRILGVVFMTLSSSFNGFIKIAYMVNHVDIAPRYAGELFGFTNTLATVPGIVSPMLVSLLTPNGTQEEWRTVFYIWASLFVFGAIVFIAFAKGEVQPWAYLLNYGKGSDKETTELQQPRSKA